jgi:tetratricopeptide (TPR) repeat protein
MVVTVVAALLLAAPPSGLDEAKKRYDDFEFDKCVKALEKAPRKSLGQHERAEVELYFGLCRYNLGQVQQAESHFELALRLEPALELPPMTSPKIEAVWARLQRDLPKQGPADAPVQPPPAPASPALTPTEVKPDPVTVQVDVPARSFVVPGVLGGAAAVAGGVAIVLGVQANAAAADAANATYQAQIIDANARAGGLATGANVAWGVAGALALGAGIALVVELVR